jgi:4,5-dihydroxyphthalate decarboxylase
MSSHMMTTARGDAQYIGVPAFLSRVFRQSGIYVRTDRGIERPADLKGKVIGVPEYQITANVWIRGILEDEYGVKPRDVKWVRGGIEEPGREERAPIALHPEIDLTQIPNDKTLSGMLESGEIDGYIGARAPSCFLRGAPNVGRLFKNYVEAEKDYFRRTKIFPIMHMVGIRKSLVEKEPWLPVSVYKAFLKSKELAMKELNEICHLAVTSPWMVHHHNEAKQLMGEDFWPYGLDANRHTIETFARYHHEQGLSIRKVAPEELFARSSLDLSKI